MARTTFVSHSEMTSLKTVLMSLNVQTILFWAALTMPFLILDALRDHRSILQERVRKTI